MKEYLQISSLTIVLVGDFNPAIVQPFWLANKKLIREQEGKDAKIDVIHNELSQFDISIGSIQVTNDKFIIGTSNEGFYEPVRDLVIGTFKTLSETPIRAIGLNHIFHFSFPTEKQYIEFGNRLVPLSPWQKFFVEPRILDLEIIDRKVKDRDHGYYRIKIQPSSEKLTTPYGVVFSINDHYDVGGKQEDERNGTLIKQLQENWSSSLKKANETIDAIWKIAQ